MLNPPVILNRHATLFILKNRGNTGEFDDHVED